MIAVLLLAGVAAAQAPTVVHQSTSGWCSPVIANVTGNVTVNCIGVDPRALSRLNAQLTKKNQQLSAKIAEANEWVDRYHELETQLHQTGANRELSKQAEEYVHQGDFEKAKAALDQLLKEDTNERDRMAGDYYQRGLIAQLQFEPLQGLPDFERAYVLNPDNLKFADKYAAMLLNEKEFAKAEPVLNAAIEKGRNGLANDPAKYRDTLAWLLYSRAGVMNETSQFKEAEQDYKDSLAQFRILASGNPDYQWHVSIVLNDLGTLYHETNRLDADEAVLNESAAILRSLPDSEKKQIFLSNVLLNQASIYMVTGKTSDGMSAVEEAVRIWRDLAKNKPAAFEPDLGLALNNKAAFLQITGHLPEAEQTAREAVGLLIRVAASDPGAYNGRLAQAYGTLGLILSVEHRRDEADANFQKSLAIYRDLARQSPQGFEKDLARILYEAGLNYSGMKRDADAEKAFDEALQIYRRLAAASFEAYGNHQAISADELGRTYLDDNNPIAAEPPLREAVDTYRKLVAATPSRFEAPMARDLQSLAMVYLMRKDLAQTRQAAEEGLAIFTRLRTANAEFDHESMARCLFLYAAVTERENPSQACSLVGQAAELATDPATRQTSQMAYQKCSSRSRFRR